MRKWRIAALALCLALILSACGIRTSQTDTDAKESEAASEQENESITNETATAALADGSAVLQYQAVSLTGDITQPSYMTWTNGTVRFLAQNDTTQYVCSIQPDGSDFTSLPLLDWSENFYVSCIAFSDELLCYATEEYTWTDRDAGIYSYACWLHCISYDGQDSYSLRIDSSIDSLTEESMLQIYDIAFCSDGTVVFSTPNMICHVDQTGEVEQRLENINYAYSLVQGASGQIYLNDRSDDQLYLLDLETFLVGNSVMAVGENCAYYTGTDAYELFEIGDEGLYAVSVSDRTKTLLIPSEEMEGVARAYPGSNGQWLISHVNYLNWEYTLYTAQETAADSVQKTTLVLAISAESNYDDFVREVAEQYNFENPDYKIKAVEYTDDALKLALTTNDAPDMILFDNYGLWEDINATVCTSRGLLVDLYSLLDADPTLSREDLLQNVLSAVEQEGALYVIPYGFLFKTVYTNADYQVPDNWDLDEMIQIASNLPDGVAVDDSTQSSFLRQVIRWDINEFVDVEAGTCDFEQETFLNLLEMIKSEFPEEISENDTQSGNNYLFNFVSYMFGYKQLCNLIENGGEAVTFPGYPGAEGGKLLLAPRIAITTSSTETDAAWNFIRTLLTSEGIIGYESLLQSDLEEELADLQEEYEYSDKVVNQVYQMVIQTDTIIDQESPIPTIVSEEAAAYFAGDKTAEEVAKLIQSRVGLYLAEQD